MATKCQSWLKERELPDTKNSSDEFQKSKEGAGCTGQLTYGPSPANFYTGPDNVICAAGHKLARTAKAIIAHITLNFGPEGSLKDAKAILEADKMPVKVFFACTHLPFIANRSGHNDETISGVQSRCVCWCIAGCLGIHLVA